MRIDYLADHPSLVSVVAGWHHGAFGELAPSVTLEQRMQRLQESLLRRDRLPLSLLARLGDGVPVGCAGVLTTTLTHQHLTPWLSTMYVTPQHRGKGVASALAERAVAECARLGFSDVFLFTPRSERLYARLGWQTFDRTQVNGIPVAVMRRSVRWS